MNNYGKPTTITGNWLIKCWNSQTVWTWNIPLWWREPSPYWEYCVDSQVWGERDTHQHWTGISRAHHSRTAAQLQSWPHNGGDDVPHHPLSSVCDIQPASSQLQSGNFTSLNAELTTNSWQLTTEDWLALIICTISTRNVTWDFYIGRIINLSRSSFELHLDFNFDPTLSITKQ